MKFSELNCNINEDVNIINFNGIDIEVKQYLDLNSKQNIIDILLLTYKRGDIIIWE